MSGHNIKGPHIHRFFDNKYIDLDTCISKDGIPTCWDDKSSVQGGLNYLKIKDSGAEDGNVMSVRIDGEKFDVSRIISSVGTCDKAKRVGLRCGGLEKKGTERLVVGDLPDLSKAKFLEACCESHSTLPAL